MFLVPFDLSPQASCTGYDIKFIRKFSLSPKPEICEIMTGIYSCTSGCQGLDVFTYPILQGSGVHRFMAVEEGSFHLQYKCTDIFGQVTGGGHPFCKQLLLK